MLFFLPGALAASSTVTVFSRAPARGNNRTARSAPGKECLHEQFLPTYDVDGVSAPWCIEWFRPQQSPHKACDGPGIDSAYRFNGNERGGRVTQSNRGMLLDPRGQFHKWDMTIHRTTEIWN